MRVDTLGGGGRIEREHAIAKGNAGGSQDLLSGDERIAFHGDLAHDEYFVPRDEKCDSCQSKQRRQRKGTVSRFPFAKTPSIHEPPQARNQF